MGDLDQKKILPLTPADRQEKQLKEAGYNVDKKAIPDGSLFLEVEECYVELRQKYLRKLTFEYDGTGNSLIKFFVTEFPLVPDLENEKLLM